LSMLLTTSSRWFIYT